MGEQTTNTDEYTPKAGSIVDDYTILEKIGEGGKSHVYKVLNRPLEATRVIKFLKNPKSLDHDRFVTEARINANLNHPNIIHCYRFGYVKEVCPYMEMEFVDGQNLDYLIKRNGSLPATVAAAISKFICDALEVLHNCKYTLYGENRTGIIHRDIKPANILVAKDGSVKLADFGIAKPTEISYLHTTDMRIVGTIFYLSPEQVNMTDVDFSSDIYGLGCVLYEMVTGTKAFKHKNMMDVIEAKKNNDYNRELLTDVPAELMNIITKCLNIKKEERYDSVKELRRELNLFLASENVIDLRETIFEFIRDPETYISIEAVKKSSEKEKSLIFQIIVATIIVLLFVLAYLPFHKNLNNGIKSNTTTTKNLRSATNSSVVTSSKSMSKKDVNSAEHADSKEKPSFKNNKKKTQSISVNDMTDNQYLHYLNSLLASGKMEKFSGEISKRTATSDGYYYYLLGNFEFENGNYKKAISNFLKSLTLPSFEKELRFMANYKIVKSKEALYKERHNESNKYRYQKAASQFLSNFKRKENTSEYTDIKNSMLE